MAKAETPAPIAQVRTVPFTGDMPKRSSGFTRKPNPFDDLFSVLEYDGDGKSKPMLTEVAYSNPDELKPYVTLLRNAATFVGKGLDVWTVDAGVVWQARPPRQRKSTAA